MAIAATVGGSQPEVPLLVPYAGGSGGGNGAAQGQDSSLGTPATQWTLAARQAITTFPVPVMRPTQPNTGLAFDLMPNGTAIDAGNGFTWFDVCDSDVLNVANTTVGTARVAVHANFAEFGAYSYGVGAKGIQLTVNSGQNALQIVPNGTQIDCHLGIPNNNYSNYLHANNVYAGTTAYAEIGAVANVAADFAYLRQYATTFTAVAGYGNWAELGTAGGGLQIGTNSGVASGGTAKVRFTVGGWTSGGIGVGNDVAYINPVGTAGAGFNFIYPALFPTYIYAAPVTGATVIILDTQDTAVIEPAGTIAALTVQLPTASAAYDGKRVEFSTSQAITALTVTTTAGTVVAGAPAGLTAGQGISYICRGSTAKWYRLV
jgi:hypothetical protein